MSYKVGVSQVTPMVDSLLMEMKNEPSDSVKSSILYELSFEYTSIDLDSSRLFADQSLAIASKLNDSYLLCRASSIYGLIALREGNYTKALTVFDSLLSYSINEGYENITSSIYNNLGIIYKQMGNYEAAIAHYLKGAEKDIKNGFLYGAAAKQANIGNLYFTINDKERGIEYSRKAQKLFKKIDHKSGEALMYNNIAAAYYLMDKLDSAIFNFEKSLVINKLEQNTSEISRNLNNLGVISSKNGEFNKAISYHSEALGIWKQIGNKREESVVLGNLGTDYGLSGDLESGVAYLKNALEISKKLNIPPVIQDQYAALAEVYESNKQFDEAIEYYKKHYSLKDSLFNAERVDQVNELNIKYEAEKKDREISEQKLAITSQEQTLHQQRNWIITIAISIVALVVILILVIRNYKIGKKTLEKEQEVKSMNAMIVGEEKERSRIAKELHDGVAGSLAAIKMRLENANLGKQVEVNESISLLTQTSREVREISHNLMPEMLNKQGLLEGINNYLANIQSASNLKIDFQEFGMKERLVPHLELTIYRILQELITNIVKHAGATEVIVQLSRVADLLSITVEDDGKGMNTMKSDGIGIEGIKSRLGYINGKLNIDSEEGKGTSAYIEIQLSK
jgi:two-component system, NarL family, sensor kinase